MVEANPVGTSVAEIAQRQGTATVADLPENIRTENYGGYEHRQVSASEYEAADANDPVVARQKQQVMEHVADINAPPLVEFVSVAMEFHE